MRRLLIAILLVGMLAATGLSQPTTQPAPAPIGRRGGGGGRGFTFQEQQAAISWAQQHMPNLLKLWSQAARGPRRQNMMRIIVVRMREFDQAQSDPAIKQRMLKTFAAEDTIAQYIGELEQAKPEERAAIREKMQNTMHDLVQGFLNDRTDRLEKLRAKLDDEQKQLDQDRGNMDLLVQRRLQPFMNVTDLPPANPSTPPADPSNAMEPASSGQGQ